MLTMSNIHHSLLYQSISAFLCLSHFSFISQYLSFFPLFITHLLVTFCLSILLFTTLISKFFFNFLNRVPYPFISHILSLIHYSFISHFLTFCLLVLPFLSVTFLLSVPSSLLFYHSRFVVTSRIRAVN